ncbi:bifunctional RNase H/acid phosphatase [Roseovarius sp. THAF9]|uniref:histidine phosphatase family protein n=1 Tax=Roseovarius sp. THAF9 TaxID=2587847 RepID=UPI001268E8D3|nr:histidine phosphatase family protein [Roseovarius sp. THAF9]QFT91756.1 bifunctional RNase H/acid phosphatase [Roseovarius sp. THAF9]
MKPVAPTRPELVLIRHAPVAFPGRLYGRTDVAAALDTKAVTQLESRLASFSRVISSPARRCRQTAEALFGPCEQDARLWEQDFGAHDGIPLDQLPDIGVLDSVTLAAHRSPGGESFDDLCARVVPALIEHGRYAAAHGPVALIVHAGVIRAALGFVTGHGPGGLAFEVAHLSITRLRCGPDGPLSVIEVNRT